MLLQKRNSSSLGISAAIFGLDQTADSDNVNASKSYGGWFNRLFIASQLGSIYCISGNTTTLQLDKSSYRTIHGYQTNGCTIYLPLVNYRDIGLTFFFRRCAGGNLTILSVNGTNADHDFLEGTSVTSGLAGITASAAYTVYLKWDGNYWVKGVIGY